MMLLGAYVSGNAPAATDIPGGGSDRPVASWLAPDVGALDLPQELLVGLGGAHLVDHQLQRLRGLQRTEDPAQLPGHDQLLVGEQQLLLAGRGAVHVQCREDATLGELAVQPDLHVPGGLELLEDDLVHARAGVHQRGRQDRQRAAVLDVAGRSEEALGRVQGRGVDTAGQDLAAGRGGEVVGARQAGDAVEQDHHVLAVLDQTLGPLDGQLGHLAVVVARPVEGRVDHLRLGGALHVGDLFRPLVDEQDDEDHLGVVGADRVGDLLHQGGLAGLWRRHDQATLPLADRGHDVHDPRGDLRRRVLEPEPLVGVQGGEVLEVLAVAGDLGLHAVDLVDPHKRRVLLGVTGQLDHALDLVAAAQARAPDHRQRHVDVVGARQVAVDPQEAVAVLRADVERADPGHLWPVVGRRGAVARVGPVEDSHVALVAAEAVAAAVAVAAPAAALLVAGLVVPAPAALLVAVPVAPLAAVAALVTVLALLLALGLAGLALVGLALAVTALAGALGGGAVRLLATAGLLVAAGGRRLGSLLRLLVGGCGGRGRGVGAAGLVAGRWLVGSAGRGGPALRHVVRVVRAVSSGVGPRRRLRGGIRRGRLLGGPPRVIAVGPAVAFAALHRVRARARGLRPRPVRDGQLGHCHAGAACSAAGAALRAVAVRFGVAAGQRLLPGRLRGDGRCRRGASTATARSRRRNELDTLGLGDDRADQVGLAQTLVTLDTH